MVFNPLSGRTHVLDVVAGEILTLIAAAPAAPGDLNRDVAEFLEVEDDEKLAAMVETTLARLDELGLIEPGS